MKTPLAPLALALALSLLGAAAVWLMTDDPGKALTAGVVGCAIGLGLYAITAVSASKER